MRYLIIDKRQRITGKTSTASKRLIQELEKKDYSYDLAYSNELEFILKDGNLTIKASGKNITEYSHIIFRGHSLSNEKEYHFKRYIIDYIDIYNSKNPKKRILVQNAQAIKNLPYYNKIATALFCVKNNFPYFDTYFRTDGDYLQDRDILNEYPLIMKDYTGENRIEKIEGKEKIKKNVFKIGSKDEYKNLGDIDTTHMFLQQFSPSEEDYRIFVKLGNVIGGWKRKAKGSFMTVKKGDYEMYNNPNPEIKEIAERFATLIQADFIAVDFMYINDKPYIQEISFHPGFKAYETKITEGNPTNIAEAIITAFRE
ncbi:MAG: seg [candidate division WS6 bacterium 36_33]|uniref:Seg n=1 Tax=candidate division WS6 bacterium 36_33 TaxID=1641388 RepID=A0A101GZB6_9BACT|nr:MAG: seg [candidate division WS6 bacterium 36_33]